MPRAILLLIIEVLLVIPLICVALTHRYDDRIAYVALLALPVFLILRGYAWWEEGRADRLLEKASLISHDAAIDRDRAYAERDRAIVVTDQTKQALESLKTVVAQKVNVTSKQLIAERERANQSDNAVKELAAQLEQIHKELVSAQSIAAQLPQVQADRDSLREQLPQVQADRDSLRELLPQVQADRDSLRTQFNDYQNRFIESDKALNSLREQERLLATKYSKLEREHNAEVEARVEVERSRVKLTSDLEAITGKLKASEAELVKESEQNKVHFAQLATAEENTRVAQAEIYSLRQVAKDLEKQAEQLTVVQVKLDEETVASESLRRELRELQERYDNAIVTETQIRSQSDRQNETITRLEDEIVKCRAERNEYRNVAARELMRAESAEETMAANATELDTLRLQVQEQQELLLTREQSLERLTAAASSKQDELTHQLEAAELERFNLQSRLDTALQANDYALERAERLSNTLAQTQTRLAERERQLATGERDAPPPSDLQIKVDELTEQVESLEHGIAARDAEISWLLQQQEALWATPAPAAAV